MKIFLITTIICAILLSGCSDKNGIETQTETQTETDTASVEKDNIESEIDDETEDNIVVNEQLTEAVRANFTIEQKLQKEYPIYKIDFPQYDLEQIKTDFFPNDKSEYELQQEESEGNIFYSLETEDGTNMFSHSGYISAATKEALYYDEFIYLEEEKNESKDAELSFMSRQEVEELCKEYLRQLGDFSVYSTEITAYTESYLNKASERQKEEGGLKYERESWTQEEEAYLVEIIFEENGLPIINQAYALNNEKQMIPMVCTMLISKAGIEEFVFRTPVGFQEERNEEVIDVSEALEVLKKRFSIIVMQNEMEINRAELIYIFQEVEEGTYQLQPCWDFQLKEDITYESNSGEQKTIQRTHEYFVNAVTGELVE